MKRNIRSLSRQERIMQVLIEQYSVSVYDLAEHLNVSSWTIRRDLNNLTKRGMIERSYGEARLLESREYASFTPPDTSDHGSLAGKRLIGEAVARLVQPGQHLALSAGTTTTEVALALRDRDILCNVVTNALNIASELSAGKNIRVTCTGGEVDGDYLTLNGPIAERVLGGHYFDLAIIGVSGIALREGLTVNSQLNAETFDIMLRHSKRVIVAADHTKFGEVRFAHLAAIDIVDTLVTDKAPDEMFADYFAANGTELLVASDPRWE